MARLGFDFGNSDIKAYDPRSKDFKFCRHAITALSSDQWEEMSSRGSIKEGFAKINGDPYAFGDAARRYVLTDNPRGASRYKREYYGVALAYMMSEVFRRDMGRVNLIATHAPADLHYAPLLVKSSTGIWHVESRHGNDLVFQVENVKTCDEPIAGYANYAFNEHGEERKKNLLAEATTLIVDVGGHTTDVAAVDPGGSIDPLSLKSTRTGVLNVISKFEDRLRAQYREMFQDTMNIDSRRIEKALSSGCYPLGSSSLDCISIAQQSKTELVNDIVQVIRAAGGVANFDYVLLTGGGGQMVKADLIAAYPGINFLMAETNPELMRFANSFGAVKLSLLMESMGEW